MCGLVATVIEQRRESLSTSERRDPSYLILNTPVSSAADAAIKECRNVSNGCTKRMNDLFNAAGHRAVSTTLLRKALSTTGGMDLEAVLAMAKKQRHSLMIAIKNYIHLRQQHTAEQPPQKKSKVAE
jgi:hypothetical protein